jgi:predicted anti-sigma-YlaC factor YlaD
MIKTSKGYQKRRQQKQITCKKATSLISAYVQANLSSQMSLLFEEHLRVCPDCVAFLNTYKKTLELAKSFLAADAPAESLARIRNRIIEGRDRQKTT